MANWNELKAAVASIVKTNGNKEITGQLLQNVLNNIISNVGANSSFAGIATPGTNPGTPDGNVFYLATTEGTYSNFNGIVLNSGEAVILEWKGSWVKKDAGLATSQMLSKVEDLAALPSNLEYKIPNRIIDGYYLDWSQKKVQNQSLQIEVFNLGIGDTLFLSGYMWGSGLTPLVIYSDYELTNKVEHFDVMADFTYNKYKEIIYKSKGEYYAAVSVLKSEKGSGVAFSARNQRTNINTNYYLGGTQSLLSLLLSVGEPESVKILPGYVTPSKTLFNQVGWKTNVYKLEKGKSLVIYGLISGRGYVAASIGSNDNVSSIYKNVLLADETTEGTCQYKRIDAVEDCYVFVSSNRASNNDMVNIISLRARGNSKSNTIIDSHVELENKSAIPFAFCDYKAPFKEIPGYISGTLNKVENNLMSIKVYKLNAGDTIYAWGKTWGSGVAHMCIYADEELTQLRDYYNYSGNVFSDNKYTSRIYTAKEECYVAFSVYDGEYIDGMSFCARDLSSIELSNITSTNWSFYQFGYREPDRVIDNYYYDWQPVKTQNNSLSILVYKLTAGEEVELCGRTWGAGVTHLVIFEDEELTKKLSSYEIDSNFSENRLVKRTLKIASDCYAAVSVLKTHYNSKVAYGIRDVNKYVNPLYIKELLDSASINNTIITWGDSLTAADIYQKYLAKKMPSKNIVNGGIGGESSLMVAARNGCLPIYIEKEFTLPADTTAVQIGTHSNPGIYIIDTNGEKVSSKFFLQGTTTARINNCYIQGILCKITWTGSSYADTSGTYTVSRVNESENPTTIYSDALVVPSSARDYRSPFAMIAWVGTNGGWDNNVDTLIKQYERMVEYSGTNNYILIGLHYSAQSQYFEEVEKKMSARFSNHYINIRKYMVERGLKDAGITPTSTDSSYISEGKVPPSLLKDAVHFTDVGYNLVGEQIYRRMIELGIITE